jgi:hypothetical protein
MSGCERYWAVVAFLTLLGCSDPDACLRHSDCPSGRGCTFGRCVPLVPDPADANDDALDAGADARADADAADARDADAADREASTDAAGERDGPGEADVTDAPVDVTDAGSDAGD